MPVLQMPTKGLQTMHDHDYINVKQTIDNARSLMAPGESRKEIRCPICGGPGWAVRAEHNDGQSIVAKCDSGCFECWE